MNFSFKIIKESKTTRARIGEVVTRSGRIKTPTFVPIGTQGSVKSLSPDDLKDCCAQIILVNTYHLYLRPQAELIAKLGGLHKFMNWDLPIMTDSGGFQVFSLGLGKAYKERVIKPYLYKDDSFGNLQKVEINWEKAPYLLTAPQVKIDDEGVTFKSHLDGSYHRFNAEKSIEVQNLLDSDLLVAFDECSPHTVATYVKKAMERTHAWAQRSLNHFQKLGLDEKGKALFGVIQGGTYKELRLQSARFICNLPFEAIAIGGVSVGETKKDMYKQVSWVMPEIPSEKLVHLLGVGEIDDIFECVRMGVDMFDCVAPTRLARMGTVYVHKGVKKGEDNRLNNNSRIKVKKLQINLFNPIYKEDKKPIDKNCKCYTCRNFSRAYLRHLFVSRELLAYRLATIHNLYFIEEVFKAIRKAILEERLDNLRVYWFS